MMSPQQYQWLRETARACLSDPAFCSFVSELKPTDADQLLRATDVFDQVRAEMLASGELI
jgi:hypothetical protein